MTTPDTTEPAVEKDDTLRVDRRRLLFATSAVAAAPVVGGQIAPAAAQTPPLRFAYPGDREGKSAARAMALESLLIEKGIITGNTVNGVLSFFETQMGPFNGAKVVARAWLDPAFKQRLADDTPAAIAKLDLPKGMAGAEGEHMRAAVNTPTVHNLIICTLCSCYPWPVLGLPPVWYKSAPYRSRAVADPRGVLRELGVELPAEREIRVWDSTSEVRYLVVPMRPEGTGGFNEDDLAGLVTRDSMIGAGLAGAPIR